MRLGSDTTNYTNHLLAKPRADEPAPVVSMGATLLRRDDRLPCSVVEIIEHHRRQYVKVQLDKIEADDFSIQSSGPIFEFDPGGKQFVFFKSQAGYWQHVAFNKKRGRWKHSSAFSLYLGKRLHCSAEPSSLTP